MEDQAEQSQTQRRRANFAGVAALLVWSLMMALLRLTSEAFGTELGMALVYTLACALQFAANRPTPLSRVPRAYLLAGGVLFASYEVLLAFAVGLADTSLQVVEVSLLNYLWPTFMALMAACMRKAGRLRAVALVVPGAAVATVGIVCAVGGKELFGAGVLFAGVLDNPLPYGMAFVAALLWAAYSTFAARLSGGADATAYFFVVISTVLWVVFLLAGAPVGGALGDALAAGSAGVGTQAGGAASASVAGALDFSGLAALACAAVVVAAGYALWSFGASRGNMGFLSAASYFAPVLSSIASSVLLGVALEPVFWLGAALVVAGSLLSWRGSQRWSA